VAAWQRFRSGSGGKWRGGGHLIGVTKEGFNGLHQWESKPREFTARGVTRDIIGQRWKKALTGGSHLSAGKEKKKKKKREKGAAG
jgi:hypothetical protein